VDNLVGKSALLGILLPQSMFLLVHCKKNGQAFLGATLAQGRRTIFVKFPSNSLCNLLLNANKGRGLQIITTGIKDQIILAWLIKRIRTKHDCTYLHLHAQSQ
jgi:hypothetical protein